MRALTYSGKRVWYAVEKGRLFFTAYERADNPRGPSVAICMASGANSFMRLATSLPGNSDNAMSGYVGHGMDLNPVGVIISTSCPMEISSALVCLSVRTTPLTCGSHASVMIIIFITQPLLSVVQQRVGK